MQDMIGNMLGLEILSGRREGRQFLSQPMHSATITSVQTTLCKISLLLLTKKNRENQNPTSVTDRNEDILKAVTARSSQPMHYTAYRVSIGLSSASI